MHAYTSYEDMAWANSVQQSAFVLEGWSPPKIARWYKMITYQLLEQLKKAEADRTPEYKDRLQKFFDETWMPNVIDENVNVDVLDALLKDADQLALSDWPQASYFKGLAASLTELRAWQVTKGTEPASADQNADMIGGGAGGSMPPLTPDFGPQEEKPPGEGEEEKAKPPGEELPGEPAGPVTGAPLPGERPKAPKSITV